MRLKEYKDIAIGHFNSFVDFYLLSMRFLFCAATEMELGATFPSVAPRHGFETGKVVSADRGDFFVHGVGVAETTLYLTQHLSSMMCHLGSLAQTPSGVIEELDSTNITTQHSDLPYDCIIQVGVCGLYPHAARVQHLYVTEVVHIIQEAFGDLGAETPSGFIPIQRLLPDQYVEVAPDGLMPELAGNLLEFIPELEFLPRVRGLTVSNITGTQETAVERESMFHAEVESMEGAAAARVAQQFKIPFLQVRSISNLATTRDQGAWKIREALSSLQEFFENI